MMNRRAITGWLAAALVLAASHACAGQPSEKPLDWDCWIQEDNSNPVSISCIRDRGGLLPQPSDSPEDDPEELLLEHIHYQIHNGDTSELGSFISDYVKVFRRGSIWSIDIHSAPYDASWAEGRPQILVRTLLCPGHLPCTVTIKRPPAATPQPTPPQQKKKRR